MTLPKHPPPLTEEVAKRFEELDKTPLTKEQREFLKECHELYLNNPIRTSR